MEAIHSAGVVTPLRRTRREDTHGDDLLPILRRLGRARQMTRGERLLPESHGERDLFLIESGAIKLSLVTSNGEELVVGLFFEGDVLGLQQLGNAPDADVATVLEPTRVRVLPLAMLNELTGRDPLLQQQLLRLASQRIVQLQQHMLVLARRSASERVAGFLVELAARHHTAPDGALRLPLSLYGIGCYLGLSLETVCRSLRRLENEGHIRKRGRFVQVLDPDGLEALAGEPPPVAHRLPSN